MVICLQKIYISLKHYWLTSAFFNSFHAIFRWGMQMVINLKEEKKYELPLVNEEKKRKEGLFETVIKNPKSINLDDIEKNREMVNEPEIEQEIQQPNGPLRIVPQYEVRKKGEKYRHMDIITITKIDKEIEVKNIENLQDLGL